MSSRQMPGFSRLDSTSLPDRQEPSNNTGQHHRLNDPSPTEWTDEKHCLYLKSMEASFVSDLHNSLDLLGLLSPPADKLSDPRSSQKLHLKANTCTSPGQFKVFRGVTWQKINFDKRKAYAGKSYGSRAIIGNSWTQHVRSSFRHVRQCLEREDSSGAEGQSVNIEGGKVTTGRFSPLPKCHPLDRTHFQHLGSVDCHTEVSDQNFIGEDIEGERLGAESGENEIKAVAADASNDDQVVPILGNPTVPEDLDRNYVTFGTKYIQQ